MRHPLLALTTSALWFGCRAEERAPSEGIYVGNPPGVVGVVGASGDRGTATVTEFELAQSTLFDCSGGSQALELHQADPLGLARVPTGRWCALEMEPDGPIVLEGEYSEVTFVLRIPVELISVEGQLSVAQDDEDRRFILELGEESAFADRLAFSEPGTHIDLDVAECAEAELCQGMIQAVETGSALFEDADKDGIISDRERSATELMRGPDRID